jgi:hypothetical protein
LNLNIKYLKLYSEINVGLNIATVILGILHYFIGLNLVFGLFFSFLILFTWIFNLILIVIDEYKTVKNNSIGKRLNLLGYGYLFFHIIALILLVGGLFLKNADWFSSVLHYSLIFTGFFGLFIYGTLFSLINYKSFQNREVWNIE